MDFWGTEIKKGLNEIVKIPEGTALHITQACLGPNAAPEERVFLECDVDHAKVILCCLHMGKTDNVRLKSVFAAHRGTITLSVLGHKDSNASIFVSGHLQLDEDPGELGEGSYIDDDEYPYSSDEDSDSFDGIEEYDGSGWDFLKRMAEGGEYEYDEDDDEEYDEDDDEDDEDGDGEEFDDEYDMGGSEFDPRLVYEDDDDDDEEDEEDGSEFDEELEYDSDGVPRLIPAVNQPLKRKIKIVELKDASSDEESQEDGSVEEESPEEESPEEESPEEESPEEESPEEKSSEEESIGEEPKHSKKPEPKKTKHNISSKQTAKAPEKAQTTDHSEEKKKKKKKKRNKNKKNKSPHGHNDKEEPPAKKVRK